MARRRWMPSTSEERRRVARYDPRQATFLGQEQAEELREQAALCREFQAWYAHASRYRRGNFRGNPEITDDDIPF